MFALLCSPDRLSPLAGPAAVRSLLDATGRATGAVFGVCGRASDRGRSRAGSDGRPDNAADSDGLPTRTWQGRSARSAAAVKTTALASARRRRADAAAAPLYALLAERAEESPTLVG